MRMRTHTRHWQAAAVAIILTVSLVPDSSANRFYFPEDKTSTGGPAGVLASYPWLRGVTLPGLGNRYRIVAVPYPPEDLGDPIMHLFHVPQPGGAWNDVAHNDDCDDLSPYWADLGDVERAWILDNAPRSSCISHTVSLAGDYHLLVYARDGNSGGRGDKTFHLAVSIDDGGGYGGWLWFGPYSLGGYRISFPEPLPSSDTFETVFVNDSPLPFVFNGVAMRTALVRFDWAAGDDVSTPAEFNFTSGIGGASKLHGNNVRGAFLMMPAGGRRGAVRFIRNDYFWHDVDGDGLGDGLEAELCTCSGANDYACGFPCKDPDVSVNPQDTDADGLLDYWEVLGCEGDANRPLFPSQAYCPHPVAGGEAQLLPAWGASPLHKDIFLEISYLPGQAPLRPADAAAINQVYGSLTHLSNPDSNPGVSVHVDLGQDCEFAAWPLDGITDQCGDFRRAGPKRTPVSCKNGGRAALQIDRFREGIFHFAQMGGLGSTYLVSDWSCDVSGALGVAHELGHQLGLTHGGAPEAGDANCKPNYRSIMNYAYGGSPFFSDGRLAGWALNPRDLRETAAYPAGVNVAFLTGPPYNYSTRTNAAAGTDVDWNRDGDYDDSVRAQMGPPVESVCSWGEPQADQPMLQAREELPALGSRVNLGPAATMLWDNARTIVVVNDPNTHRVIYNVSSEVSGGWATNWSQALGGAVHGPNCQPAAATLQSPMGPRVYIFGATADGRVQYVVFDQNGIGPWSDPMENPAGVAFDEVSVTTSTNPSVLFIVGRDRNSADGNVWENRMDALGNWRGWEAAVYRDTPSTQAPVFSHQYTPGVAWAGDGNLYLLTRNNALAARPNLLSLWRYLGGGFWETYRDQPADFGVGEDNLGTQPMEVTGRPTLLYRPHRKGDGTPLASGNGALWAYYQIHRTRLIPPDSWNVHYRWSYGKLSHPSFTMGDPHDFWIMSVQDRGVAVVDHPESLSLFAPGTPTDTSAGNNVLHHMPYADGQSRPAHLINDWDDATTVRWGLKASLP
ncbi:MAG: hypothetical protein HY906_04355 [Deltaproteobacteria bacterium]|nr:hypothetical protein [Deltaproteobacteria bacterium]